MATYHRPWMYAKQLDALFCKERYGVIEASTKAGKTVGCMAWILEQAILQQDGKGNPIRGNVPVYWWVAPIYMQAKIVFRRFKRSLPQDMFSANNGEMTITLVNGSVIFFKSAEKPDNLYGEDVFAAVLDEASRMREEAWTAVRSTLTATRGPVRIIGNVRGKKNWAYRLGRLAKAGQPGYHYAKLNAWDAVEGGVLDRSEVEDAQAVLPPDVFAELYLAEATDDGANPFDLRAIADCCVDVPVDRFGQYLFGDAGISGPPRSYGWDLARGKNPGSDWTVGIGLNGNREVCAFDRFQGPWSNQLIRIRSLTGNVEALCDSTGLGDPVVEELQQHGGNYEGYKFSMATKQVLMEDLAIALQRRTIKIPNGIIRDELEIFEYEYTRTGVRYSAPEGMHDDTVCALALANHHLSGSGAPRMRWI